VSNQKLTAARSSLPKPAAARHRGLGELCPFPLAAAWLPKPMPGPHRSSAFGHNLLGKICSVAPGIIARLDTGINVLVVDCGPGELLRYLGGMFPRSRIAGIDPLEWNVACARQQAHAAGRQNVWVQPGTLTTHTYGAIFHLIFHLAPGTTLRADEFAAARGSLRDGGSLILRHDGGPAYRKLRQAGFASVRHVVLADADLPHVYVARR